jgi:predicted ATPase
MIEPLLVLDNCEHVRETCAALVERLLESVPALRVLATSRERLGVPGEVEYELSPLAVPAADLGREKLVRFPSVQLFLDRASATGTDLHASPDALSAVARICRDLDGLPLAIELAAVRAKSLSPEEIAANLDQRFEFLKFWRQVAVPRHQTLRATMDWSYELLSESEQQALRRLSVFAGGFTLEPCALVCTGAAESAALDLLARLVDRSLVIAEQVTTARATGCSRRSGSTLPNGLRKPARRMRHVARMPMRFSGSRKTRSRRTRTVCRCSDATRRISAPRSTGRSPETGRSCRVWLGP